MESCLNADSPGRGDLTGSRCCFTLAGTQPWGCQQEGFTLGCSRVGGPRRGQAAGTLRCFEPHKASPQGQRPSLVPQPRPYWRAAGHHHSFSVNSAGSVHIRRKSLSVIFPARKLTRQGLCILHFWSPVATCRQPPGRRSPAPLWEAALAAVFWRLDCRQGE